MGNKVDGARELKKYVLDSNIYLNACASAPSQFIPNTLHVPIKYVQNVSILLLSFSAHFHEISHTIGKM